VAHGENRYGVTPLVNVKANQVWPDHHRSDCFIQASRAFEGLVSRGHGVEAFNCHQQSLNHSRCILGRISMDVLKDLLELPGGAKRVPNAEHFVRHGGGSMAQKSPAEPSVEFGSLNCLAISHFFK
jgi:hypothetical protein